VHVGQTDTDFILQPFFPVIGGHPSFRRGWGDRLRLSDVPYRRTWASLFLLYEK
jgi:hypothetical protein